MGWNGDVVRWDPIGSDRNPFGASAAAAAAAAATATCGILIYGRFMHLAAEVGVVDLTEFMSGQLAGVYYILHIIR